MEPGPVVRARHYTHLDHTLPRCLGTYQKAQRIQSVSARGMSRIPSRRPATIFSPNSALQSLRVQAQWLVRLSPFSLEQALESPGE